MANASTDISPRYEAGSRATSGVTIQVLSGTGVPVPEAMVTFQLPDSGPSGTFRAGGRTEIGTTGPDGALEAWGMLWSRTPGQVSLRVTATKDGERGSLTVPILLTKPKDSTVGRRSGKEPGISHGHSKLWIGLALVAGASVAVAGVSGGKSTPATGGSTNPTITIGSPTITLIRP